MEESQLLNKIYQEEKSLDINNDTICGVPLWRIVRYKTRLQYLNAQVGYVARTSPQKAIGKRRIKICSGFWKYMFKKDLTIVFPFNRLVLLGSAYLDKFTDPVIEESDILRDNCVIVDPPSYISDYERIHKSCTISNESRTLVKQVLNVACKFVARVFYHKKIKRIFNRVKGTFQLQDSYIKTYYGSTAAFLSNYVYYHFWFRLLRPRRVFIVYREGYFPIIAVCKKLHIPVAEFQHGITHDKTVSFTGDYDNRIDPDYFFVFGNFWRGPQFGMSLDRIVNIGWAYKLLLLKNSSTAQEKADGAVLVISSPEISDAILDAVSEMAKLIPAVNFHIRLHPCEGYNDEQRAKLQRIGNAQVVDNKLDSSVVLPRYSHVIGENSSVLYEALSFDCHVALLNFGGLKAPLEIKGVAENFFVISQPQDFMGFLQGKDSGKKSSDSSFYSDFDQTEFNNFINTSM